MHVGAQKIEDFQAYLSQDPRGYISEVVSARSDTLTSLSHKMCLE